MLDRCQYAYLIKGILLLPFAQLDHLYLFHGVFGPVCGPLDAEDCAVSTLTYSYS